MIKKLLILVITLILLVIIAWTTARRMASSEAEKPISIKEINSSYDQLTVKQEETPTKTKPVQTTDNTVIPIFLGAVWKYQVEESITPLKKRSWTYRVDRVPDNDIFGISGSGFEDSLETANIVDKQGDLRLDGLGFWEPKEFAGTPAVKIEGETIPRKIRLVEGAVWELRIHREIEYDNVDKKGKQIHSKGLSIEYHRASFAKTESVTTPKGIFDAMRINWLSRVSIETKGRPLFSHLTTAPYRKETMWIVPGIGIVKRHIEHLKDGHSFETLTLSLVSGPKTESESKAL